VALPWCTTLDVRRGPSSPLRLFGDQQAEIGRVFPRVCHVGQVKGILGLGTVPCEPAKPLKTRNPLWAGSALLTSKNVQRDKPCARTGCRTGSSPPTQASSTTAVPPGTSSRISPGSSCPSASATGPRVLINGTWYKPLKLREAHSPALPPLK
jgi:hypothetical protein